MVRTPGDYYQIKKIQNFKEKYRRHWGLDYDIQEAKKSISKFKELLRDIFNSRFYKYLKEDYIPRIFKYKYDELGKILRDNNGDILVSAPPIIQFNLPDLEDMAFAMGLFRQFFLKQPYDKASIHNLEIHFQTIGDDSSTTKFDDLKEKLECYLNAFTGTHFRWSTREEKTILIMKYRIYDWFEQLNYGGGKLAHDSLVRAVEIGDRGSINKIIEYFFGCLVLFCRIGMIYKSNNFNEDELCRSQCPFRIYYGNDTPFIHHSNCRALPISFSLFHVLLEVDDSH